MKMMPQTHQLFRTYNSGQCPKDNVNMVPIGNAITRLSV